MIGTDTPITGWRLLEICEIHLLYIGVHMFAELKHKPFKPITATAILEPPSLFIPNISAETGDNLLSAIDLSVKQPDLDNTFNSREEQALNVSQSDHLPNLSISDGIGTTTDDNMMVGSESESTTQAATQPIIHRTSSPDVESLQYPNDILSDSVSESLLAPLSVPKKINHTPNTPTIGMTSSSPSNSKGILGSNYIDTEVQRN